MRGITHVVMDERKDLSSNQIKAYKRRVTICEECDEKLEFPWMEYFGVEKGLHEIASCDHPRHAKAT